MKIIYINHGPYNGSNGVHVHFLAQHLTAMGHTCIVALTDTTGAQSYFGEVNYHIISHNELRQMPPAYFKNSVLHTWTPREVTRLVTLQVQEITPVPYIVHLEDNEIKLLADIINIYTLEEQKTFAKNTPQFFEKFRFINPLYFEEFMKNATGITCIIKKLEEFVPENIPKMTFWPACEDTFYILPQERDYVSRSYFDIDDNTYTLAYPGYIGKSTVSYFVNLLYAVEKLNGKGYSIKILRTGIEYQYNDQRIYELYNKYVLYFDPDLFEAHRLPYFISLADILVQPGCPGTYDDYRFPSKIPFFLASGRPVILPNTNVAEALTHGRDCFLLQNGGSDEIAHYIELLIEHPALAKNMGSMGRATARRLFDWQRSADAVLGFYRARA